MSKPRQVALVIICSRCRGKEDLCCSKMSSYGVTRHVLLGILDYSYLEMKILCIL